MAIIYIGRSSPHHGKRVFEILANLKSFGKGRILERLSLNEKYKKKSFYIVKDACPQMDKDLAFGYVYCEFFYQEMRVPGLTELLPYRPDFRLVPKHLEDEFLEIAKKAPVLGKDVPKKLLPQYYSVPPLMAEILNRRKFSRPPCLFIKGLTKEAYGYDLESLTKLEIPYVYSLDSLQELLYRTADESKGEKVEKKPRIFVERLLPRSSVDPSQGLETNN